MRGAVGPPDGCGGPSRVGSGALPEVGPDSPPPGHGHHRRRCDHAKRREDPALVDLSGLGRPPCVVGGQTAVRRVAGDPKRHEPGKDSDRNGKQHHRGDRSDPPAPACPRRVRAGTCRLHPAPLDDLRLEHRDHLLWSRAGWPPGLNQIPPAALCRLYGVEAPGRPRAFAASTFSAGMLGTRISPATIWWRSRSSRGRRSSMKPPLSARSRPPLARPNSRVPGVKCATEYSSMSASVARSYRLTIEVRTWGRQGSPGASDRYSSPSTPMAHSCRRRLPDSWEAASNAPSPDAPAAW
jgi:hypothetical protein